MRTIDRTGTAVVSLPSDLEIQVVRQFDAPAALVYEVWTTPEHIRNWWGYPEHEMTVCEMDLRVGGSYRFAANIPDFGEMAFHGVNLELDPPHRLVSTEIYEAFPDVEAINTLTLSEQDGVTTMTILSRYPSREVRDGVIRSGMERGLQVSLNRAEAILMTLLERADG